MRLWRPRTPRSATAFSSSTWTLIYRLGGGGVVLAPCSRASTTRRCRQTIDQRQRKSEASLLPCLSECGALSFISSGVRVDHSKSSCRRPPVRDPPVCLAVVRNMDNLVIGQPCFILYDGEWLAVQYFADVYAGPKFAFPDRWATKSSSSGPRSSSS